MEQLNWDAISAIGEVVGAVAVLLSLYYLASQIRRQNHESRRATNEAGIRHLNETFEAISGDPDLADIVLRGTKNELSDSNQMFRYISHMGRMYRGLESIYLAHLDGEFDARVWEGMLALLGDLHNTPGNQDYWSRRKQHYSAEFREFMDGLEGSSDRSALLGDYFKAVDGE